MKLYYSKNSPYARIARIAIREYNLHQQIEELIALNRQPNNPVLKFSPVGRVPTLVHDNLVITESRYVYNHIVTVAKRDHIPMLASEDLDGVSQEGQILGFLEGIVAWVRENRRESSGRSPFLLNVENDRVHRCISYLENEAKANRLPSFLEFRSMALASAIELMDLHILKPNWRASSFCLARWFDDKAKRQSMRDTAPEL